MRDIVIDTDILADFLIQYFTYFEEGSLFSETKRLSEPLIRKLNGIVKLHRYSTGTHFVIASSFAFVEIARQFVRISANQFSLEQFRRFINEPPEWFLITSLSSDLLIQLAEVPSHVTMPSGQVEPIEWADAIHIATAISRDNWYFATTDSRIRNISKYQVNIL